MKWVWRNNLDILVLENLKRGRKWFDRKIYKKLGDINKALQFFTKALDLDPKDTNMVKSLIDKIHSNTDINEDADI